MATHCNFAGQSGKYQARSTSTYVSARQTISAGHKQLQFNQQNSKSKEDTCLLNSIRLLGLTMCPIYYADVAEATQKVINLLEILLCISVNHQLYYNVCHYIPNTLLIPTDSFMKAGQRECVLCTSNYYVFLFHGLLAARTDMVLVKSVHRVHKSISILGLAYANHYMAAAHSVI